MTLSDVPEVRGPVRVLFVTVVAMSVCCYPDRQATLVDRSHLDTVTVVTAPTKVFLMDATVALFPEGFRVNKGILQGNGVRFSSTGVVHDIPFDRLPRARLQVPRDSAVAMTYYDRVVTGGRGFASFFHGLTGSALTATSVYCMANPKACFGSCPTVYARNGDAWEFKAELFSYSISRLLESGDLDRIGTHESSGSPFMLRVANEALETHHINVMRLLAVRHPAGTLAFPATDGSIVAVGDVREPLSAVNSTGEDVLRAIRFWDDASYRSDSIQVRQVKSGRTSDWVELRVRPPNGSDSVIMVLRLRNTLLSTLLFYEIVLGSQGVRALDWTSRMNTDPLYASQFRRIYSEFSGLKIKVWREGQWRTMGSVPDVGPVGWKPIAVKVPVMEDGELGLRLEFFPDNVMIDYVGFAVGDNDRVLIPEELFPTTIRDETGAFRPDLAALLAGDDDSYVTTEPQNVYRFEYDVPPPGRDEVTLFVRSKGYYTEWIRGTWISAEEGVERFDLQRIDQTMVRLADLWIRERNDMESLFFRNRIPVTEDL